MSHRLPALAIRAACAATTALSLAAAGCGTGESGQTGTVPLPMPSVPNPSGPMPGPQVPGQDGPEALLRLAARAVTPPRAYEAVNSVQEWESGRQKRGQARLVFRPPATARTEFIAGDANPVGMAVLSQGGPTVQIKLPGVLSFVRMTVSNHDTRARSMVGLYPDEVTPDRFYGILHRPGVRLALVGQERVGNRLATLVRAEGTNLPAGMTGIVVGFDATTGEWLLGRYFRGQQLRYETLYTRRVERSVSDAELVL